MASCLHSRLEGFEGIVSGCVGLLTDLILFDLADIIELVLDRLATLIDHVYSHVCFWVVAAQSCFIIRHLRHGLTLLVLQLKAHISWVSTEFPLKEVLALCDRPVKIKANLWEESTFHVCMCRVEFHNDGRCRDYILIHCFNHFYYLFFLLIPKELSVL